MDVGGLETRMNASDWLKPSPLLGLRGMGPK
jgi:hypothetical protein